MFSHGAEIPEALIENIFADYKFWSHEADFDGHEGVFYKCGMTDMLNRDVGNIQQKIDTIEVRHLVMSTRSDTDSAVYDSIGNCL